MIDELGEMSDLEKREINLYSHGFMSLDGMDVRELIHDGYSDELIIQLDYLETLLDVINALGFDSIEHLNVAEFTVRIENLIQAIKKDKPIEIDGLSERLIERGKS